MSDLAHFDDLTKINVPFGLLDEDTQERLIAHEGEVETFVGANGQWLSFDGDLGPIVAATVFRAKPIALTKPSVNWSHVHSRWQWLARDADGWIGFFEVRPQLVGFCWERWSLEFAEADLLASLDPGTCDWKDSLVRRAEEEAV